MNKLGIAVGVVVGALVLNAANGFAEEGFGHRGWKGKKGEHFQKYKQENREFRKSLKDLSPQDRVKAIQEHREKRFQERQAFREKHHTEMQDRLKDRLAKNPNLTDTQRAEALNAWNEKMQAKADFNKKQYEENQAFLKQLGADANLTPEARKEAMKKHFQEQREERKQYREEMKDKYQSLRETWKKQ